MTPAYAKVKKWREKNPLRVKAQRIVFVGLRNKSIVKKACFCGIHKTEAHHEDYSQPLQIMWLCKKHHAIADIERRKREKFSPGSVLA